MLYAIVVCSVFLFLRDASSTKLLPLLEILCLALLKHLRTCVAAEEGRDLEIHNESLFLGDWDGRQQRREGY